MKIGSKLIDYDERPLVNTLTDLQYNTVEAKDRNGNTVVVPGKFRFAGEQTDTVEQGIVIEDSDGNQFVWIPVSNIDGKNDSDDEREIIKDDGTEVTIPLARCSFDKTNGNPTPIQYGSQYDLTGDEYGYLSAYFEINEPREASGTGNLSTDKNATAKSLPDFVASVEKNHGYYIGRYEASYGSGSTFGAVTEDVTEPDVSWYKPLVQPSTANSTEKMNYTAGTLWNFIIQGDASKVSRNMYNANDVENNYVESDLVNSYAWDTAIAYIQAMRNSNYANQKPLSTSLTNTGTLKDEKCKIFDMCENCKEWTTETRTKDSNGYFVPSVSRGGNWSNSNDSNTWTAIRYFACVTEYSGGGENRRRNN